jgi:hypothetical protein
MDTKTKLKIAAGIAGMFLIGSVWVSVRSRKQDHNAALFFSELERSIAPASVGLVETDAFKISYWQDLSKTLKKSYLMLKMAAADGFAGDINDSWGFFNDDEEKIYGVFRALKDHVQVSQVSDRYFKKKKINLIDDLRSRLSKGEVSEVLKIVGKMPPYRLAGGNPN